LRVNLGGKRPRKNSYRAVQGEQLRRSNTLLDLLGLALVRDPRALRRARQDPSRVALPGRMSPAFCRTNSAEIGQEPLAPSSSQEQRTDSNQVTSDQLLPTYSGKLVSHFYSARQRKWAEGTSRTEGGVVSARPAFELVLQAGYQGGPAEHGQIVPGCVLIRLETRTLKRSRAFLTIDLVVGRRQPVRGPNSSSR